MMGEDIHTCFERDIDFDQPFVERLETFLRPATTERLQLLFLPGLHLGVKYIALGEHKRADMFAQHCIGESRILCLMEGTQETYICGKIAGITRIKEFKYCLG